MLKFFLCILTIFGFSFMLLSCQSSRRSEVSANDTTTGRATAQNSENKTERNTKSVQSASAGESGSLEAEKQEKDAKPNESKIDDASPTASGEKIENRCGWFENPTPGSAWLTDRDGEWLIGAQGGHQAEGDWPDFADNLWVKTNVSYGYGCACLRVKADFKTRRILEIVSATAKPLSACRNDPALTEPNE